MLLLPFSRHELLHFLPKGGTVVEIGVAQGAFSREIRTIAEPERLHLVDPWRHQADKGLVPDPENVSDDENERRYQSVLATFADDIAAGRAVVHRALSTEAAATFPDGYVDWVFIDGDHSYEAVRADLKAWHPKIKTDGLILGHDYTNQPGAKAMNFGVIEAVDEFCRLTGHVFVALTQEGCPTYVLSARPYEGLSKMLVSTILADKISLIEIRDFPGRPFIQKVFKLPGSECPQFIMSF